MDYDKYIHAHDGWRFNPELSVCVPFIFDRDDTIQGNVCYYLTHLSY